MALLMTFHNPKHPTLGPISSMPDLDSEDSEELYTIPGAPPNLINSLDACATIYPLIKGKSQLANVFCYYANSTSISEAFARTT